VTRPFVPGRLAEWMWPVTSYLVTNLSVVVFWLYFFVLNRTTVIGRHHVGTARNTLLVSNHQSMIDSFLVGLAAYFPRSLVMPHLMPWNPAAAENFFRTPLLAWLAYNWRCIPVREGRRDMEALRRMSEALPRGVMTLFPEGTRTRDGSVGAGRAGAGLVVLSTHPRVIPVAIEGMDRVLPIGCTVPRLFQRVYVCYGEPVDCAAFFDMPRTKATAALLVDRVMSVIRVQHAELRRMAVADGAVGGP